MHLFLFVRGKFEQVELWKAHVQTSYWKWRRINNVTGQEEVKLIQGALRPSVLGAYEFIFPKEALAEVCSFLGLTDNVQYGFGTMGLHTRHFCLRKIFGCKKLPKEICKRAKEIPDSFTTAEFERGVTNAILPGVACHIIGIKEDIIGVMGNYTQEMI